MATNTTVITSAGVTAALTAGSVGPQINIGYFRIGADVITPTPSMTDVANFQYQGTLSQVVYRLISPDTVVFQITLDETVGSFAVGNIALFLDDDTMFMLTSLATQTTKFALGDGPNDLGNRKIFSMVLKLDSVTSVINLSVLTSDEAALPRVGTELDLPDPLSALFPVYVVDNFQGTGGPTIAIASVNGDWAYMPSSSAIDAGSIEWSMIFGA